MKKIVTIVLIVLVALFIIGLAKNQIIKSFVVSAIKQTTGTDVSMGSFSLNIFTQTAEIKNFKIYNPAGFPKGILLDLTRAKISLDVPALFRNKLHIKELTIELKELDLVKNKQKELNVDSLKVTKEGKESTARKEQMPMQIDILHLSIGKIVSKDYSSSATPQIDVYDVNMKKTYKNITSVQQLVVLILTESMKAGGIKGAQIYGIAMLTGVGFVPIAVGSTLLGRDNTEEDLDFNYNKVYDVTLKVITKSGRIKNSNKETGIISAEVDNAAVNVYITQADRGSKIKVSARKYFIPKPEIAKGIIYRVKEELR